MKIFIITIAMTLSVCVAAQCLQGGGFIDDAAQIESADCVDWVTFALDLKGAPIDISFTKTADSVVVSWPASDGSIFKYYQDTVCQRSQRDAVWIYNQTLNQLFDR